MVVINSLGGVDLARRREDDFCVAGDGDRLKRTAFRRTGLRLAEALDLAKPDRWTRQGSLVTLSGGPKRLVF